MSAGAAVEQQTWALHLEESAREVFATMLNTAIERDDNGVGVARATKFEVTAMVGLAGTLSGNFVMRCSRPALEKMAEFMLGAPANEAEAIDALGEICNMLAGSWKRRIDELVEGCLLSVPAIVLGSQYEVHSPDACNLLKQQFSFGGEIFTLQVKVQG